MSENYYKASLRKGLFMKGFKICVKRQNQIVKDSYASRVV